MRKEAEEYAKQLEAALDGTEEGYHRYMLAASKLLSLGKIATPAVLRLASSKELDSEIRTMAIEIVAESQDTRALGPLVAVARDGTNPIGVRSKAAYSIGYIGTGEVVDSLLAFIHSEDRILKSAAISGIRAASNHTDVGKAFGPIVAIIRSTADERLRKDGVAALSAFGDRGVPLLIELLEDDNKEIRPVAMGALGGSGSHAAVKPLVELLSSEDERMRVGAIMSLERLGDTSAVPALIETLLHEGVEASFAARALGTIGDPRALGPLKKAIDDAKAKGRQPSPHLINAYEEIKKR